MRKRTDAWAYTAEGSAKYREAYNRARLMARESGLDVGIERNDLFREFSTFYLPRPENRSGHELRCEVVRPDAPECR